jgi:protein required for attachment to host cells
MLIPHGTLVAIADGAGLALYRNTGTETALKLASVPAPKIASESHDSGKRHRSSAANPDDQLLREDAFAAALGEWLNRQALEGKTEHVFVVAPPKFLGELRRHYHKVLQAKLVGELAKDLGKVSLEQIEAELKSVHPG